MATLVSPGVSISVTDESFYAPAGAGTVPLIVIATAQDKTAPDGTSTAAYTTAANANNLYLITSQRELLQNFGNPSFKTSGGSPIHGDETNEYGLVAAYSFLGISNRAYVLRADIDLSELESSATAPSAAPADGTVWLDTASSTYGLKEWDGTAWVPATVTVATSTNLYANATPKAAYGIDGQYTVVSTDSAGDSTNSLTFYEKTSGTWDAIGSGSWTSATSSDFQFATHTTLPQSANGRSNGDPLSAGDLMLQTTTPNNGIDLAVYEYSTSSAQFVETSVPAYETPAIAYDAFEAAGTLVPGVSYADRSSFIAKCDFKEWNGESTVTVASSSALTDTDLSNSLVDASNVAFNIYVNNSTTAIPVYIITDSDSDGNISVDDVVTDIQTALSAANVTTTFSDQLSASNVAGKVTLINTDGRDITLAEGDIANVTFRLANINLTAGTTSNFTTLVIDPSATEPVGDTADGQLWYDADISTTNVDLLEHDGSTWVTFTGDFQTSATEPTLQSDGISALASGDVWINSADTENIKLYKYDGASFNLVDQTDQSSPDGILFADFRTTTASLDADAPSAALYPTGMLAWNYRASGGNVKQWNDTDSLWENYSGNNADGSGILLRKAQRKAVVRAMQSAVSSNEDIRNETNRFNIVAVPGYPELTDEMLTLSVDRKDTVFALIDPPFRLSSSDTDIQAWATNSNNAIENGEDGLVSASSQAAVYYPSGLTTNLDGTNIMVPASHMALRTIAYNDQVAFPWFAPAGYQRGVVNNVTSVGYLDAAESEYVAASLNNGQRDTLYLNKVNPIATFPGRGISVFGQKTLNPTSSALDRINVSRLVIYLREQLDDAVRPFLFEPNDAITRTNAKTVVDRILSELITQRGLFDYVTVCDESNNTPARINRNELHIDIAIQPVKAVEFIYIPIRIQSTLGSTG